MNTSPFITAGKTADPIIVNNFKSRTYDAVVVGSGPNGFGAAITMAKKGLRVVLLEAGPVVGGGIRSHELTLPGYIHDICATVYPLIISSPFFSDLPLKDLGIEWIYPQIDLAHPFEDGTASTLMQSVDKTADSFAMKEDEEAYKNIFGELVDKWGQFGPELLLPLHVPKHPYMYFKFGWYALHSAVGFVKKYFKGEKVQSLILGNSAHAIVPLKRYMTSSFGLALQLACHMHGWPFVKGGSGKLANALAEYFKSLGGAIYTNYPVRSIDDISPAKCLFFDLTPRQVLDILGDKLPVAYRSKLKKFKYGQGIFKIDWALSGQIPFTAEACRRSAIVHIAGPIKKIIENEDDVWSGKYPEFPFVLLAQPTLYDKSRAPEGKHIAWAYCHVPAGSQKDMTAIIERQIEKFAPGFSDLIIGRHVINTDDYEKYNENNVGGDINGGLQDWTQFFTRPVISFHPSKIPFKNSYFCSSSSPPGGGVHGMGGYNAAKLALKEVFHL